MSVFLYKFFHNRTNDRTEKGLVRIPKNIDLWPESWKIVYYKNYSLLPPVRLKYFDGVLWDITKRRQSRGRPLSKNVITLDAVSYMLQCCCGLQHQNGKGREENRVVPSAGHRYPLEAYVFFFKDTNEYKAGVYHYGVKDHLLEPVIIRSFSADDIASFSREKFVEGANGFVCFSAVFNRTIEKYGSRGYRYILIEAGHIAQNLIIAAKEKDISVIPIGGSSEETIERYIGLNSRFEGVVYTLFF